MKRWLWWSLVGTFIAVIFIGYGLTKRVETNKVYRNVMSLGQTYVTDGNYAAAQVAFQDALKKKPNDKTATVYLAQTKTYGQGLDAIEAKKYEQARTYFKKVAAENDGLGILVKRASEKQTELKEVIAQRKNFQTIYAKAKSQAKNYEYSSSNTQLAIILGYSNIKESYYADILKKAQALKRENDARLRELGYTVQPAYEEKSAKELQKQNNITKSQLAAAKKELKASGVNVSELDDKQIIKIILQAKAENKSIAEVVEEFK